MNIFFCFYQIYYIIHFLQFFPFFTNIFSLNHFMMHRIQRYICDISIYMNAVERIRNWICCRGNKANHVQQHVLAQFHVYQLLQRGCLNHRYDYIFFYCNYIDCFKHDNLQEK